VNPGKVAYIAYNARTDVGLIRLTGDPALGFSHVAFAFGSATYSQPTTVPPAATQSGSSSTIDSGDDRFMSAVMQGGDLGNLWTSAATGCIPTGDTIVRSCIKVLRVGLAGPSITQDTVSGMNAKYLIYPTLALNANLTAVIDYSLSSDTDLPSHGAILQLAGTTTLTGGGIIEAGTAVYSPTPSNPNRWGDYGAAATDPTEPTKVWVAGEFSAGQFNWATGIAEVVLTSLQASPTGAGYGGQLLGTASAAQAITVTNTGDFSTQVNAAVDTGDISQFHMVDNTCASVILASTGTCTAHYTFNPTTAGDKQARFNIRSPGFGTLAVVLSGTGVSASCSSTAIDTGGVTSPQNVGTPITLGGTELGCPGTPLYQFWLRVPVTGWVIVKPFSVPGNSFLWDTTTYKPGTYLIGVWVKDSASTKSYDAYAFSTFTLQFPYCSSTNVTTSTLSPQPSGTTVNFAASNDAACPTPTYQWWVRNAAGVWSIAVPFTSGTNAFAWDTTGLVDGTYQIGAWIKEGGSPNSYDGYSFVTFTVATPTGTTNCQAGNVSASVPSPQSIGTAVTFTSAPASCSAPQFKWWVRDTAGIWAIVKDYPVGTATYDWPTGSLPAGTYQVGVWVRQTGSTASYQAYSFITYTLTLAPASRPCSSVNITPDVTSPQSPGSPVNFTAAALGCTVAPDYKFWLLPPGGVWTVVQNYGGGPAFPWTTTGLAQGPYQVGVWARRTGSTFTYEAFAFITFQLQVVYTACTTVTVTTSPGQVVSQGPTSIVFTATASGCPSQRYKFFLRTGSGGYIPVGPYGSANTLTLALNTAARTTWNMVVQAEDAASPAAYDSFAVTDFRVI
jgi:hypothetical protein